MNPSPTHTTHTARIRSLLVLLAAAALLLAACTREPATQIPLATPKVPSLFEINGAIERWDSSGNDSYVINVDESSSEGQYLYRVVVVNESIQAAQRLEMVDGQWVSPEALPAETAERYTVPALLARIQADAEGRGAAPLNMTVLFDSITGYPTLVQAKAIQSYNEEGKILLNREHSYTLSVVVDIRLEDSFGAGKTPLLTVTRSGGEQAACSTLRIFSDGAAIFTDSCRQILLQLRPPEDSFKQLSIWTETYSESDFERTVEGQTQVVTLHGTGSGTPESETVDALWESAIALDDLLSRPIGEGVTVLRQAGDILVGFDMRSNLEQQASLDLAPPLYGAFATPDGVRLVFSDSEGLKWLDTVTGGTGTYLSNPADSHLVPIGITGDGRILLRRVSGSASPTWGWVSLEERGFHELPDVGGCVTGVWPDPSGGRAAVTTAAGDGCESDAAMWVIDLAAGEAAALETGAESAYAAAWSPDGSRIAVALGAGEPGREVSNLYLVSPDGSGLSAVTENEDGRISGIAWRNAGETLVYGQQGLDGTGSGLIEISAEDGAEVNSLIGEALAPIGFDPSGEFLAFADGTNLRVWLISFGQVVPVSVGTPEGSGFVGFIGGGD